MRTITGHTRNYYKTNIEKPHFGQHTGLEKVLDVKCKQMSRKRIPRVIKITHEKTEGTRGYH